MTITSNCLRRISLWSPNVFNFRKVSRKIF